MNVQVQIEKTSPVTRKLTIQVPIDVVNQTYQRKFAEVQKMAKIPGFRQGMVPIHMIKSHFGHDIQHKVADTLIDESLNVALHQENLRAVGQPQIEPMEKDHHIHADEGHPFKYIAIVEIYPEVEVKNYKDLSLTKEIRKVKDADITEVINGILDRGADLKTIEGAAKEKDFVEFEFEGTVHTKAGDKKPEALKGRRTHQLTNNELLPDFEKAILGMKAGEEKTFEMTYADNYPDEELKGNKASFLVKLFEVKQKILPELTDAYAKEAGYESAEQVKEQSKKMLTENFEEQSKQKLKDEVLKTLIEKNKFDVPASMIASQKRELATRFASNLIQDGYEKAHIKGLLDRNDAELSTRAEFQIRAGILLTSIAKKENIKVDAADFEKALEADARLYNIKLDEARDFYTKDANRKRNFELKILEEKTVDLIVSSAKVKEKEISA